LKNRFIVTFTGGLALFLRFINRLLGFLLFFTGAWIFGLTFILLRIIQQQNDLYGDELILRIIGYAGVIITAIVFFWNLHKFEQIMPDSKLKRIFAHIFNRPYSPEREGNNIAPFMKFFGREIIGFFFGTKASTFLEFDYDFFFIAKPGIADGHIVVVGGAGSGKSSCIAIPTLESWEGTIFAIDIKGELSNFYKDLDSPDKRDYIIFDPTDPNSKGYDPFYLLRNSETEGELVQHVRELALSIIPLPPNINEPFWIETAQNILTGGILYYFYLGYGFSETMDEILSNPVEDLIEDILNSDTKDAHKFVVQLKKAKPEMIASFATTLSNHIMVFATDTQIYDVLSKKGDDCFRIDDFDINIFLRMKEDKIEQWKPLITLINNQRIRASERRADKTTDEGKELTPTLMLLDEFPRLGKVEAISGALATLRSKGVTIALFIQSLAQLDYIYGDKVRRIILDNCSYKAILNVADPASQDYFSKLTGTCEVEKKGHSVSYDADSGIETGASDNFHLRREPIIHPHEFAKLNDIVLLTPMGFCRVDKEPYYNRTKHTPPTPPPTKVTDITDPLVDAGKNIIEIVKTKADPSEFKLFPDAKKKTKNFLIEFLHFLKHRNVQRVLSAGKRCTVIFVVIVARKLLDQYLTNEKL